MIKNDIRRIDVECVPSVADEPTTDTGAQAVAAGKKEIRSQSSSSRSAVQQAIIDCSDYIKMVQKPRKIKVFRGFLIPKRADIV